MIKKFAAILMCVLCMLVVLVGCGSDENSEIVGKWIPTTANINGETVKYDKLNLAEDHFGLTFTADGKCTATLAGVTGESDYSFNGTSVDIKLNGEEHKLEYSNNSLKWTLNYGGESTSFTFAKENKKAQE